MKDISSELVDRLREEPSTFVRKILGKNPYVYQEEFIDSKSDRKAVVGGRQIGKTTMMSWMAIHEFTMFKDRNIILVAPTQRQALNFMRKLKKEIGEWIESPNEYGLVEVTKSRLIGANGSRIEAYPALEETIRGLTVHSSFVDEASFIDRHILTSIISPMMATTDGQYVLGSTPWGQDGYFYGRFDDENDLWFSKRYTSMENPDIPSTQIEEWRRDMTEMEFQREVLAQFTDKKNSFFKNRDINTSLDWLNEDGLPRNVIYPDQTSRKCFLGVDPASTGDDSAVLTSIDQNDNVFDMKVIEDCEIPELEREIRGILNSNDRNYISAYIEENGLGEGTVHRFKKEFNCVEGFRSTIRSKESIYNQLKNKMQKGELNIPDREDLKKQMRTIEYEMTDQGNMKIYAPTGLHDDMADSIALAVASKSGKKYVDRQKRFFSFGSGSTPSSGGKRAYTFN